MKLEIIGFRCYKTASFEFPSAGISLLAGVSGAGKSTIFQAIYWCLYGKLRNVYAKTHGSKCQVTVVINMPSPDRPDRPDRSGREFQAIRQKKPDRITVIYEGCTWTDTVAQDLINQIFGDAQLWVSTSYIQQSGRCQLLAGSQKEKLVALKKISLGNDDPGEYINKIDLKVKQLEFNVSGQRQVFDHQLAEFTKIITEKPVDTKAIAGLSEVDKYQQQKTSLIAEIAELYQQVLKFREFKGQSEQVNKMLSSKTNRLTELTSGEKSVSSTIELDKQITELRTRIGTAVHQDTIKTRLSNLENSIKSNRAALPADIAEADLATLAAKSELDINTKISQYKHGKSVCEALACQYTLAAIKVKLTELQDQLQTANELLKYHQTQQRITSLKNRLIFVDESLPVNIAETEDKLRQAHQSLNLMTCPDCESTLRFISGKLVKVTGSKPVTAVEIMALQTKLNQLNQTKRNIASNAGYLASIQELESLYSEPLVDDPDLPSTEILKGNISRLQSVMVTELPPYSVAQVRQAKQILDLERQLDLVKMDLKPGVGLTVDQVSGAKENLKSLQARRDTQIRRSTEVRTLEQEITRLRTQQFKIQQAILDNPEIRYQSSNKQLAELNLFLEQIKHADHCVKLENKLKADRSVLELAYHDLAALQNLKASAIKVEYQQLDHTVSSINLILEETLEMLFTEPIQVSLSMFKTLKTSHRIKPEVNLSIFYRGIDYDSVNQMSGGEGDRVSLAVIVALGIVSTARILLLDECLSSLNAEFREAAVKMIRKFNFSGRTVLIVDHESVEGLYDKIIRVVR